MADSASEARGGPAPNETIVAQPDSSHRNEISLRSAEEQTHDAQTAGLAVGEAAAQSSAAAAGTAQASRGNDHEEPSSAAGKQREGDSLSIGPTDLPPPAITASNTDSVVCAITLLLPTGARHPYRIDEKYLAKRNVEVPDVTESGEKDPFSISVYKLKELILREWREEWDGKPASPSSIRLIHFGKLLDDKEQLKKYHFSQDSPNVVHMSVRPPEMMEEEETGKGKGSGREGRNRDGGSGCCVIL